MEKKEMYEAPSVEVMVVAIESCILSTEKPDDLGYGGSF